MTINVDHSAIINFEQAMMQRAARLALRGIGRVHPNPPVGCVIVNPYNQEIITDGWHTHFGGPHAEVHAISRCKFTEQLANATAYITLEPCNHFGKTPPCTEAIIKAGIKQCIIARKDPSEKAGGGCEELAQAGIAIKFINCPQAQILTDPFVKRITTGLPWIIAKTAQTIDGKIATHTGDSKWISNNQSRTTVHRMRARVDAIMTGIGTVISDNPMLTARNVRLSDNPTHRVIIDWNLAIPATANLITTSVDIKNAKTIIITKASAYANDPILANHLQKNGIEIIPVVSESNHQEGKPPIKAAITELVKRYNITTILLEAGGGLTGELLQAGLIDEWIVYMTPRILGDKDGISPVRGYKTETVAQSVKVKLHRVRRMGDDLELLYKFNS